MFHRIILAAASVVALTAAANAADMYRPAEGPADKDTPFVGVNWSGLYFGANGGYGEASNDSSINGGFGGGQIGYNIQRGNIVAGLRTDIQGSSISGSNTQPRSTISAPCAAALATPSIRPWFTARAALHMAASTRRR